MPSLLSPLLGIKKLNPDAQGFVKRSISIFMAHVFLVGITNTFMILFALEHVTVVELGWIVALQFAIQALTDYPTGALGDWVGQRWVLTVAAVFYSISFLFLSQASGFVTVLVAFLLFALAQGQESGAFVSWFDNNYKIYASEDQDRRIYSELMGKFTMFFQITMAVAFIGGAYIVHYSGRAAVFLFQGVGMLVIALIFFLFIKDHPSFVRDKPNFKAYFGLLGTGVTSTWKNRTLRLLILGIVISGAAMTVWGTFLLFPLYESYGKTDDLTGLIRSSIFVSGAIITGLMGVLSKRLHDTQKWLGLMVLISNACFFWGFVVMLQINPAPEDFSAVAAAVVVLFFALVNLPMSLRGVLMPRFFLDVIPDKNRNSVYSLIPTLVMVASIVSTSVGGAFVESTDTKIVLLVLGAVGLIGSVISAYAIFTHKSAIEEPVLTELLTPLTSFINKRYVDLQTIIPITVPPVWVAGKSARKIWDELVQVALADGQITDEERCLLSQIMGDVRLYAKMLEDALEDGIITKTEYTDLLKARELIWHQAHATALTSDGIGEDEHHILLKLAELMRSELPVPKINDEAHS